MITMDARAAEFNQARADRSKGGEIELLRTIISDLSGSVASRLQPMSTDDLTGWEMFNKKMVANLVEFVSVQASLERFGEAFVQFEIEDFEPKTLGLADFIMTASETGAIRSGGAGQQTDSFKGRRHRNIISTPLVVKRVQALQAQVYCFFRSADFIRSRASEDRFS